MKKTSILLIVTLISILFCNTFIVGATGATYEEDGFTYGMTNIFIPDYDEYVDLVTLIKCDSSKSGEITLPEEIEFYIETEDDYYEEYYFSAIGERAFSGCNNITAINIPHGLLENIKPSAFDECPNLTKINVNDRMFSSLDGVLYSRSGNLIRCPEGYSGKITAAYGTTQIGEGAFKNCSNITEVTLNEKLSYINEGAFSGCENLTSITVNGYETEFSGDIFGEDDIVSQDFCIYAPENSSAQLFAEEYGYTFMSLPEKIASDLSITALSAEIDGKSKIVVTAKNDSAYDIENATALVSGYDDLIMKYITTTTINVKSNGESSVILPIPNNGENYTFKSFIWENKFTITPVASPAQSLPALPEDISYNMNGIGVRLRGKVENITEDGKAVIWITDSLESEQYESYEEYEFAINIDNAESYLGRPIEFFAENDTINSVDIFSPAENTVSFTFDAYDSYEDSYISYYKNPDDRNTSRCKLERATRVLLNGEEYALGLDSAIELIEPIKSGRITLVDANSMAGYEIIEIDIYTSAVVNSIDNSKITFKEIVYNPISYSRSAYLYLDDILSNCVLKEDGNTIDVSMLKEWDVISFVLNANEQCVEMERIVPVISSVNARQVSNSSYDGYAYRLQGDDAYYQVAEGYYADASIKVGSKGKFFIDKNNKIVAFLKHKIGLETGGKHGYIINTAVGVNEWDNATVYLKVMDNDSKIHELSLANTVIIENLEGVCDYSVVEEFSYYAQGINMYNIYDMNEELLESFSDSMRNRFVAYEVNSAGEITSIAFPSDYSSEDDYFCYVAGIMTYRADERNIRMNGTFELSENITVFYMNSYVDLIEGLGDTVNIPSDELCFTVSDTSNLADRAQYDAAVFDINGDESIDFIVLFNTTGGINPASSLAVIESIYPITTGEGDDTLFINYYQDGELKSASVANNVWNIDELCDAKPGDLYKFNAPNSIIRDFVLYSKFERYDSGYKAGIEGGLILLNDLYVGYNEYIYRGVVTEANSINSRMTVATTDNSGVYNIDDYVSISITEDTNIYVVNPDMKDKLSIGTIDDICVDEILLEHPYSYGTIESRQDGEILVQEGEQALGMLDYAVIYECDGDVKDVIIYKSHDFGKYIIRD